MSIRTNYEKRYADEAYYWGTEPGAFLDELIRLCPPAPGKTVLDIGCGEGKDAVYMAEQGYAVTAFDLTENGIRKTLRLAREKNVTVHAYAARSRNGTVDTWPIRLTRSTASGSTRTSSCKSLLTTTRQAA